MLRRMSSRGLLAAGLMGFAIVATLSGVRILIRFDQTPGARSVAPPHWPIASAIQRHPDHGKLLVFVHPFCPCSTATLAELARILTRQSARAPQLEATILFVRPKGATGWQPGHLWDTARELPGAHVMWDEDGQEAQRFGARTSGEVFLYDSRGDLLFHGGITGSRGHAGDNYAADQSILALNSGRPARSAHLVFGCALPLSTSALAEVRQ